MIHNKPLVSGSALQWEGQITVLNYLEGPCYRCLYPKPPPAAAVTNCSDGGVVGMVPGIIGQLQAVEIVKIIIGESKENILWRRMIFLDALSMKFRNVKLRERNLQCVACGPDCPEDQKVKNVEEFDYADFCQTKCNRFALIQLPPENTISAKTFLDHLNSSEKLALIDVRPPVQFGIVNTNDSKIIEPKLKAQNIILRDLTKNKQIFDENDKVFIMCRRGNASKEATELILNNENDAFGGVRNVFNVEGGLDAIREQIDQSLPYY